MTRNPGRVAGLLYLVMIVLGGFSLLYVPATLIVPGDAHATASNILASESLYRLSIVSGLASAVVFLFLGLALYRLLSGISRGHAMVMVGMMMVAVAIGFALEMSEVAVLVVLHGADILAPFSEAEREALAMLFVTLSQEGSLLAQVFWGLWLFPFGLLVARSGSFPRLLGYLLILNGAAYLVGATTGLLAPAYVETVSQILMVPELGEIVMMLWLLVRGASAADG